MQTTSSFQFFFTIVRMRIHKMLLVYLLNSMGTSIYCVQRRGYISTVFGVIPESVDTAEVANEMVFDLAN